MLLRVVGSVLAVGCVLAVWRVGYPYIIKGFPYRYECVIGVGGREENRTRKTQSGREDNPNEKNRVGFPRSVCFFNGKAN